MAKQRSNTAIYTSDFRHEFAVQTSTLLRRRMLWFTGTLTLVGLFLLTLAGVAVLATSNIPTSSGPVQIKTTGSTNDAILALVGAALAVATYILCFLYAWLARPADSELLRLSYLLVLVDGVIHIALDYLVQHAFGIWGVTITHILACAFLPWTTRQSIGPMVPLVLIDLVLYIIVRKPDGLSLAWMTFTDPLVAAPGTLIAYVKHSTRLRQYQMDFLRRRYGEIRRELVDARRIHEALFPQPISTGPVRFHYEYEPMRQIGGDFLFAHSSGPANHNRFSMVLIDVTGHGIAAALTVNRMHGELERLFAEHPNLAPGNVLKLLNRYVHLTLARHSVYATVFCVRIDPEKGELEYASGGHPPAFLRGVDGTVQELHSTSFVLGACGDDDFQPAPETHKFGPGDVLVCYTDGATEARAASGRMFGVEGLQRLLAGHNPEIAASEPDGSWARLLLSAVDNHRAGPPSDDTLLIEIARPIATRRESSAGAAPSPAHVMS
ncbi:MAG: PP2C family protein-serine/threonine phosphatase [Planctomycetota bacterium]|nr:PP2C family protein-serine/threonine phosphatase [Planctomycetota bacterium]